VNKNVHNYVRKSGLAEEIGEWNIVDHIDKALALAHEIVDEPQKQRKIIVCHGLQQKN
jgi:hypothetical protein